MPKQFTIRGVSEELVLRLARLSRAQDQSVNATALRILEDAVGIGARRQRLARYATWSASDPVEFNCALADQHIVMSRTDCLLLDEIDQRVKSCPERRGNTTTPSTLDRGPNLDKLDCARIAIPALICKKRMARRSL